MSALSNAAKKAREWTMRAQSIIDTIELGIWVSEETGKEPE